MTTAAFARPRLWRYLVADRLAVAAAVWLGIVLIGMIAAFTVLPETAVKMNLAARNLPPFTLDAGWLNILGADTLGRSMLARLMVASATTLSIALASVLASLIIGTLIGIIAGYYGGWIGTLYILLGAVSQKRVVVGKCLQPRGLADGQAAALGRVRVDEIVPVLGNMAGDRRRRAVGKLNPEAIIEFAALPVAVIGSQGCRKIRGPGADAEDKAIAGGKQIAGKIGGHVSPRVVLRQVGQVRVAKPQRKVCGAIVRHRDTAKARPSMRGQGFVFPFHTAQLFPDRRFSTGRQPIQRCFDQGQRLSDCRFPG